MQYYARIDNNKVVEVISLPNNWVLGKDIFDQNFASQCVTCDDTIIQGMLYNAETQKFSDNILPKASLKEIKTQKEAEFKAIILQQEQKLQRSSQEITEALLNNQEANQADVDAFNALHSAKKLNQAKLIEIANATSKEELEPIQARQVEYINGEWQEV